MVCGGVGDVEEWVVWRSGWRGGGVGRVEEWVGWRFAVVYELLSGSFCGFYACM